MKKYEREQIILERIKNNFFLTTKEYYKMTNEIGIAQITARRDLITFQKLGHITVTLGAIKIIDSSFEKPRNQKKNEHIDLKREIAMEANGLLDKNDIIYVSAGTTCEMFVKNISHKIEKVVTNGLEVFMAAKSNKYIKNVVLIGGRYRSQSSAFVGRDSISTLDNYNFTKSFSTGTNVDSNLDIFNNNDEESMIFIKALSKSKYKVGLFDSSKFEGSAGLAFVTSIKELDLVITDKKIDEKKLKEIKNIKKW